MGNTSGKGSFGRPGNGKSEVSAKASNFVTREELRCSEQRTSQARLHRPGETLAFGHATLVIIYRSIE
jgi:hypothetical protein